jgi:hypothetical protein
MKNNPTNSNLIVIGCLRETVESISKALNSAKEVGDNDKISELEFIKKYIQQYVDFLESNKNENLGGEENGK